MELKRLDPLKTATIGSAGVAALDPVLQEVVATAIRGGCFLTLEEQDDGNVSLSVAGVVVAKVPLWRIMETPRSDA